MTIRAASNGRSVARFCSFGGATECTIAIGRSLRPRCAGKKHGGVHSRLRSFVEGVGVAGISNCTEYTVEMRGEAISVRVQRREDSESALVKCSRLVTIRKSDLVDLVGVVAISNCTRCRLEIAEAEKRQPARQAILRTAKRSFFRLHGAVFGLRVPKWEENLRAGTGEVPGMGRPAAVERVPRRMSVLWECWGLAPCVRYHRINNKSRVMSSVVGRCRTRPPSSMRAHRHECL
jgi:hypothetical protein